MNKSKKIGGFYKLGTFLLFFCFSSSLNAGGGDSFAGGLAGGMLGGVVSGAMTS